MTASSAAAQNAVAFEDLEHGLRVVTTPEGPVVEIADGRDATGTVRWIRAVVQRAHAGSDIPVYRGWKEIASALGVAKEETAQGYARRPVHPLPVRRGFDGHPWIYQPILHAWVTDQAHGEGVYPLVAEQLGTPNARRRLPKAARLHAEQAQAESRAEQGQGAEQSGPEQNNVSGDHAHEEDRRSSFTV